MVLSMEIGGLEWLKRWKFNFQFSIACYWDEVLHFIQIDSNFRTVLPFENTSCNKAYSNTGYKSSQKLGTHSKNVISDICTFHSNY